MIESRSYLRKEEIWIGYERREGYLDICVPSFYIQVHIRGNRICSKTEDGFTPLWNNKPQTEKEWLIVNGDEMCLGSMKIIFFSDRIEVQAEQDTFWTGLLPVKGEGVHFEGFPCYKRSPRVIYRIEENQIEIQMPPQKREMAKGSMAQMIIPSVCMLAFTIAMGIFLKRGAYVYMAAGMTVITTVFSIQRYLSQKRQMKNENKEREAYYEDYMHSVRRKIRKAREKERQALDYQFPELPKLANMVEGYSSRIYERSALEADFLQVNLGYRSGASKVEVHMQEKQMELRQDPLFQKAKEIQKEYAEIERIPVTVDLKQAHLGIVGSKENVHEQLKYLLAQLTFFQSYHDLQIVFIHDKQYESTFSYTRWYPHLRIQSMNVIAAVNNEQTRDQILGSLQQTLKERRQRVKEEHQETVFLPHFIFVVDEPKIVLNHAVMEYLQSAAMDIGVTLIYTTDQQANLPENIGTVCLIHNKDEATLLLNERVRVNQSFKVSHIGKVSLERMARDLSALIHEQGISSKIPERVTFFDMYHVEHPEELKIRERWRTHDAHKSLAVPLGLRGEEDTVELNLHEKAHGPHGLVAGTTGSGKSEIIQSYILSLAVNFHPHEVGFLLIDYKGGGMANLFAKLPHLLGTITNLDKAESMRAMESVKSEMHRRERIFGEAEVNHINGYNQLFKLGKVKEPLPHLFLISDEFAELKKEQPEFMSELVSAARVGRSLGIHLILATQKPSGVVDDQIWTNSKFKLCLKVQNAADSKEMLHTPDAANIIETGRAYLQVGNNEIYELFQSAWSGAPYDENTSKKEKEDIRVYLVNELGQGALINRDLGGSAKTNQIKATQLDVIVEHIEAVYKQEQVENVKRPWLPPLSDPLLSPHTQEVRDSAEFERLDTTLGIGIVDIPEEQLQEEYQLNLLKNGHLLYMASSGYGKSMFLTGIVLGLSMKNAVENINFYLLDLGNSAIIPLQGLPHVADYMGLDDLEKIGKFQRKITEEMTERKRKFRNTGLQNISVYNESQAERLKAIVIVIDNYDAIKETDDAAEAFIQKAARDGASLGIYLIVTMTRANAMKSAIQNTFKEKVAGFHFDASEVRSFIGRSAQSIPEDKKGRALVKRENVNLMQIYTPVPCESEVAYNRKLKERIEQVRAVSSEEKAKGIPTLPDELFLSMLPDYPAYECTLTKIPVGIDVDELNIKYLDLKQEIGFVIGGSGSGRTNTIKNALKQLKGQTIFLFDAKNGHLRSCESWDNLLYAGGKEAAERLRIQLEILNEKRKQQYEQSDGKEQTFAEFGHTLAPVFIIIDVVLDIYDWFDNNEELLDLFSECYQSGMYLLVTADGKLRPRNSSFLNLLAESKTGLILGNIKNQGILPYGTRMEENRKIDFGYFHQRGENQALKLIAYTETEESHEYKRL